MNRLDLLQAVRERPDYTRGLRPKVLRAIGPTLAAELQITALVTRLLVDAAKMTRRLGMPEALEAKKELVADAGFEKEEHPRGQGGRFAEKGARSPGFKFEKKALPVGELEHIEKWALGKYCGPQGDAGSINRALRRGDENTPGLAGGDHWDEVRYLDKVITRHQAPADFVALRGVSGEFAKQLEDLEPGTVLKDRGYLSVTTSEEVRDFHRGMGPNVANMKINVPAGTPSFRVPKGMFPFYGVPDGDEKEHIIARGSELILKGSRRVEPGLYEYEFDLKVQK